MTLNSYKLIWIAESPGNLTFLLQTGNAFNETRIWNPTSPIVAASAIIRPQRNIDTSNLLGSLLGGVGSAVGGVLGLGNSPTAPSGTVGMSALSRNSVTAQSGGKGLLRADTANAGLATFRSKWGPPATGGGFLSDFIKKTFNNFIPARQEGIKVRSDEKSYGWMIGDGTWAGAFDYGGTSQRVEFHQRWIAGDKGGIRIADQDNMMRGGIVYTTFNGLRYLQNTKTYSKTLQNGIKFGWSIEPSTDPIHPGIRYENAIGMKATDQDGEYFASSMMVQWGMFQETGKESQYPSKMTDPKGASVLAEILYNKIQVLKENPIYTFPNVNSTDNGVFPTKPYASIRGYERLMLVKNIGDPKHFGNDKTKLFTLAAYRAAKVRVLENQHTDATEKSFKMGGSQQFDGINTLTVLDSSRVIKNTYTNNWKKWEPYKDDLIAFYFYDIVNQKYIPFRATIKGLQETDSVNWEELTFIGRADKVYSYGGFNRSLAFSFTVHIGSIIEMAPTWQRVNYLMSLVKPASYTKSKLSASSGAYTRFMVPPMVMITIGDMYKNQPVVIGSLGITIPENASWETLNEKNSTEWSYLVDYIKSPKVGMNYGQLPRTMEISVNAYLLEKERAIVGAAHFGHAPHNEQYDETLDIKTIPNNENPTELHKSMVVYNQQS